jgi:hypothetical protein
MPAGEVPIEQLAPRPKCGVLDDLKESCGADCEEIVRAPDSRLDEPPPRMRYFTGLCKYHGEIEFSERWQRRWAQAEKPDEQKRLIEERKRWEGAGHVYRGTSERERSTGT